MINIFYAINKAIDKMRNAINIEEVFIDINFEKLFSNPENRKILNEAIDYIKENKAKEKEITLINGEKLVISK